MNGIVLNCLQSHYNTVQKNNNKEGSKKKNFTKPSINLSEYCHLVLRIWVQALSSHCLLLQKDYLGKYFEEKLWLQL